MSYQTLPQSTHIVSVGGCCDAGSTFEDEDYKHQYQVLSEKEKPSLRLIKRWLHNWSMCYVLFPRHT